MSLRKFMHPKNKYKNPPDFKQLAVQYPEFRKIAIVDLAGKVKLNFKSEETLRVLTEVLLKHDFNLNVKIPPNKLVPTLPLRLNYILWLEDLLNHCSFTELEDVIGVDIGAGAICIYPLLFAKMYGTQMISTEVDESSIKTALEQIKRNNLDHLIKIIKVNEGTILKNILEEDQNYHFSMCNPPFFEVGSTAETTIKKIPPRNAPTGNEKELMVDGGERAFVTQMIDESIEVKEKIKIYTTMIGRRINLVYLIKYLAKKEIGNMTWTEFCQGHTKRWGLAWSFAPKKSLDLTTAPVIKKSGDYIAKFLRDQKPAAIVFPLEDKFSTFEELIDTIQNILEELNIRYEELELPLNDFDGWARQLTAAEDTWSHARRKRRLAKRQTNQSEETNTEDVNAVNKSEDVNDTQKELESCNESKIKDPLLVCNLFIDIVESEDESNQSNVKLCLVFEKGVGGKNCVETFRQYLINKLDVRQYFQKYCSTKKRKKVKESSDISLQLDTDKKAKSEKDSKLS